MPHWNRRGSSLRSRLCSRLRYGRFLSLQLHDIGVDRPPHLGLEVARATELLEHQLLSVHDLLLEIQDALKLRSWIQPLRGLQCLEVEADFGLTRFTMTLERGLELFLKARMIDSVLRWRRPPALPHHANEILAGVEVLIDQGLRTTNSRYSQFPADKFDVKSVPSYPALVELVHGLLRGDPLLLQIVRRSEKDANDLTTFVHAPVRER